MELTTKIKKIARVIDGGNTGLAGLIIDLEEKIDSIKEDVANIRIPEPEHMEDRTDEEIIVEVNIV